ncbi:hypothetical protein ABXK20_004579 [Serratia marcescens]|uniref:hypothetical protein n=1 Tax=Serratia marcescens TaxID=615 RepID=UPI0013E03F45|nr:hypothetical protein [Serratia marcescens]
MKKVAQARYRPWLIAAKVLLIQYLLVIIWDYHHASTHSRVCVPTQMLCDSQNGKKVCAL